MPHRPREEPEGPGFSRGATRASLTSRDLAPVLSRLKRANRAVARAYPGESERPQPVHTVYGGGHLFTSNVAQKLGTLALESLLEYAPDATTFARALGLPLATSDDMAFADTVRARVVAKLEREPVEDLRIDFEDGYGVRPDAEEDGHVQAAAEQIAEGMGTARFPSFIGIRIKPLSTEMHARSLRTLDLFVTSLSNATRRKIPEPLLITIPKVMTPVHVTTVAETCDRLEQKLKLKGGAIRLELMIETPQSVLAPDGSSIVRALIAAGKGRVTAAHFGTYDYTALCGITASWQHMRHPACDFARHMMQVALAQSGVQLSDGGTNVMPVPIHRAEAGRSLSDLERQENVASVHRAWRTHFEDVKHSLMNGFYQGWDLHPAQLPTRFAAVFSFFLAARPAATARLRNFVEKAAQATLVGDVFDDAATGQGLLNFFARGVSSGALTMGEASETGLTPEELRGRSFLKILDARKSGIRDQGPGIRKPESRR
jgi:citrate lyase beta subunit